MLSLFRKDRGFFDDFFEDFNVFNPTTSTGLMKTDIKETDQGYELSVELPGYAKDDVRVSLDNGYLMIEANKTQENEVEDKDTKYIRKERYVGTMKRSYYVGKMSLEDIQGTFDKGILHIAIPKETKKEPEKRYLELK